MEKIKLGISSCLLGNPVRYDGQHKRDLYIVNTLGQFFDWVPICPEVDCGMPVPREAMRLVKVGDEIKRMTHKTKKDMTPMMTSWTSKRLEKLAKENICGFIFKKNSPSSGMAKVKIYTEAGIPNYRGSGVFAGMLQTRFPLLPVEDEGRLHDLQLRENFLERVFIFHRWQQLLKKKQNNKNLSDFHARHKYLIMAHNPKHLKFLGQLAAGSKDQKIEKVYENYLATLMETLKLQATTKKNVNVLMHLMGYFKRNLTSDEKQELLEQIGLYGSNLVPIIVPVTLLNHYIRKYDQPYLKEQLYLHPHPVELMLRNHI